MEESLQYVHFSIRLEAVKDWKDFQSSFDIFLCFFQFGQLYELRLMMDFSGSNRGYFFVRYTNRDDARMAVREMNNYEIRPGHFIGVVPSVDNRKLWISGIPKNRTSAEIQDEIGKFTDKVHSVCIYSSHTDKSKTNGY
jgi:hypothetical protein